MINHIKTLLANLPSSEASEAGLAFYVDPSFSSVRADSKTEDIRKEFVDQPAGMSNALDAAFSIVSRIDMREHTALYDGRILEKPEQDRPLFDGFDTAGPAVSFSVFYKKGVPEHLFSRVRSNDTDDELQNLKSLWLGDVDGNTGLAACILALVARLDFYRKTNLVA